MRSKTTAVSITAALAILATPALAAKPTMTHASSTSPAKLCQAMSHKKTNHGKGKSPFAACVSGAAKAKADLAKTPSTKTNPATLCATMSHKKSSTDTKSPYSACVSGAAKAQDHA